MLKRVKEEKLVELANSYQSRPSYIIDVAKKRLEVSVRLIGEIVERNIADKKIRDLLREKELILREVHHRIKNNMSTMIYLLQMQAANMKNSDANAVFKNASARLKSMAVLYDKLYCSKSMTEVSINEYLPSLVKEIVDIFPNRESVKIKTQIDNIMLEPSILSPLGIILNELITNAMKYGFLDRDDGLLTVSALLKDNQVIVIVENNGNEIPESVDISSAEGFGLQLVAMLTEQIKGSIRLERRNGAKFTLTFPSPPPSLPAKRAWL